MFKYACLLACSAGWLAGCAAYRTAPIRPLARARQLEQRSLSDQRLRSRR